MADNRKLAQGLMMMTPAMREDLAGREQDIQRGKTVELLRRAGKEMYENPVVNTAVGLSPVLGDIQAGVEAYRSAQAGDWGNAGLNAAGMLPFIPMLGKTVWHGSPHTFDKFDMSKIGTGEGAQAYGHGLYLAEAPEVAEAYKGGKEGMVNVFVGGKEFKPTTNAEQMALNAIRGESRTIGANPIDLAEKYFADNIPSLVDEVVPKYEEALKVVRNLKEQNPTIQGGSLYKVDLPDEQIAKMLDWDNPITEEMRQPISQAMMEKLGSGLSMGSGEQAYKQIVDEFKFAGSQDPKGDATKWMLEQGVPGIQYLDQASRGAGDGTRNYVVFSDEIPQILERNGTLVNK